MELRQTSWHDGIEALGHVNFEPADAAKRLDDHYPLLHKYWAHLTWERVSKDAPEWDYPAFWDRLAHVTTG